MAVLAKWYDSAAKKIGDASYQSTTTLGSASISIASQPMKVVLLSSSYTFSSSHTVYADISGSEIANGNGYTTGGASLASVAWTQAGAVTNFTAANVTWTASGTGIPAFRYAALYCTATLLTIVKPLILVLDNNGSDVALTPSGSVLQITWNATGIFQQAHS